ncbi:MAG: hypothetical protein QW103_02765, partial [Candidatus Pacearchaeota archaeon]
MEKRGQQEIAGFVIIVLLVMVAVFIFVIMYFANKKEELKDIELQVLLNSMLKVTTDCYLEEKTPSNLEEVIEDAYSSIPKSCKNKEKSSRDFLEEYIPSAMKKIIDLETKFDFYILEIVNKNDGTVIKRFSNGNCEAKETKIADSSISNQDLLI